MSFLLPGPKLPSAGGQASRPTVLLPGGSFLPLPCHLLFRQSYQIRVLSPSLSSCLSLSSWSVRLSPSLSPPHLSFTGPQDLAEPPLTFSTPPLSLSWSFGRADPAPSPLHSLTPENPLFSALLSFGLLETSPKNFPGRA